MTQLVSDYTEIEMQRKVDADGMATEEYNFNSEVAVEHQVKTLLHDKVNSEFCTCVFSKELHFSPAFNLCGQLAVEHWLLESAHDLGQIIPMCLNHTV